MPVVTDRISLIIPLRLTAGTYEGEERLKRLCQTVPRDLFDIMISDYGTEPAYAGPIKAVESQGVDVVRHPSPDPLFSIGAARDFGVQTARQNIILFNDIDFLGTPEMYRTIHAEAMRRDIARNMADFFCVPVLFLTEQGTRAWFDTQSSGTPFVEAFDVEWLEKNEAKVQFTAFGSSAMVINKQHYLSLGGHDQRFRGHGAEDYDLLHRLSSLTPKAPRPHEYYTDYKTNSVRRYWGFRPFFALYGLDVFARELHLVHLWHPRRREKGYFRSRPNFRLLKTIMTAWDKKASQPAPLPDLTRQERWLVVTTGKPVPLQLRQVLAMSGTYKLLQPTRGTSADTIRRLAESVRADRIIFALPGRDDLAEAETELVRAGYRSIRIPLPSASGRIRWVAQEKDEDGRLAKTVIEAEVEIVRAPNGQACFGFWQRIVPDQEDVPSTGKIPRWTDADLEERLKIFGGVAALTRKGQTKPKTARKASLLTRLARAVSRH
jgi:hypothetical protein